MALTIQVTKKSVSQSMEGMWLINLNLSCLDGEIKVIDRDFSIRFKTGNDIELKVKAIREEMQKAINQYKTEQVIFNHAKLTTALIYLNSNLVG
jgi:hypothetical protein